MKELEEEVKTISPGSPHKPAWNPEIWYYVQSEADIFTNDLEKGVHGSLMKSTIEVEWLIGCKEVETLAMLVQWDASYGNAHSSLKQKITIWNI